MIDGYIGISQYVEKECTLRGKIKAIDNLIYAFELKLLDTVGSSNYSEYQLDDGQMKVRTTYRSPKDVTAAITELEKLKQRYVNRLNGRVTVLRGGNL
jgi:hypothetical protein